MKSMISIQLKIRRFISIIMLIVCLAGLVYGAADFGLIAEGYILFFLALGLFSVLIGNFGHRRNLLIGVVIILSAFAFWFNAQLSSFHFLYPITQGGTATAMLDGYCYSDEQRVGICEPNRDSLDEMMKYGGKVFQVKKGDRFQVTQVVGKPEDLGINVVIKTESGLIIDPLNYHAWPTPLATSSFIGVQVFSFDRPIFSHMMGLLNADSGIIPAPKYLVK